MKGTHPDTQDEEPLDTMYGLLRNGRRRMVMHILNRDGKGELRSLADEVAARENDKDPEMVSSQERKRVYVGLYQAHLPKMDGAGVIDYEQDRGTIEKGERFEEAYQYIEEEGDRWPVVYMSYGVGGAIAVISTGSISSVAAMAMSVSLMVGVAALAALQHRQ